MKRVVADCHHDLLLYVEQKRLKGLKKVILKDYIPEYEGGGFNLIICSIFISEEFIPEMALRKALDQISALYSEIDESEGKIALCRNYEDVRKVIEEDKIALMLSLEGADPIMNDLNLLRIFYELGVRFLGLTWSRRNYVADGSFFMPKREGRKGGITNFGVQVLDNAQKLGMIIDISHLNDEGVEDVFELYQGPIIASHSNCREIVSSMRNLTDKQIKKISSRNGIIGINSANIFTGNIEEESNIEKLSEHVLRLKEIAGIDSISLGLDICENFELEDSDEYNHNRKFRNVISKHSEIKEFKNVLLKKGLSEIEIENIFGENLMKFLKKYL